MPKRFLSLAGDDRLVDQIRGGNEAAFEVAFERYGAGILSFCRHMLGSREEAEDAVQHTFASAYRDLMRDGREISLKPWLYTIARNRCFSVLRARRDHATEEANVATAGLHEQVQHRAELKDLLRDLSQLPEEQRAALILSELGDLSHAEIADVLGCEVAKVKALVFRARSGLIQRREARETPCADIREQLANVRGGSLRRRELRHHLELCAGCRAFREDVKRQRQMLALVLPVAPSLGLKPSVLSAAGVGGGSGGGGAALGGLGAGATAGTGSATLAKVAVVGVLAGGGAVAGEAATEHDPANEGSDAATARGGPAARAGTSNGGEPGTAGTMAEGVLRGPRGDALAPETPEGATREGRWTGVGILPAILGRSGVGGGGGGQMPDVNGRPPEQKAPAGGVAPLTGDENGGNGGEGRRAPEERRRAPEEKRRTTEEKRRTSEEKRRTSEEKRPTAEEKRRTSEEKRRDKAAAAVGFELLDALASKGARTTAEVARALGISETEAERQLREAQRAGLVDEEIADSDTATPGSERSIWRLTKKGRKEWERLRDGRGRR